MDIQLNIMTKDSDRNSDQSVHHHPLQYFPGFTASWEQIPRIYFTLLYKSINDFDITPLRVDAPVQRSAS